VRGARGFVGGVGEGKGGEGRGGLESKKQTNFKQLFQKRAIGKKPI
jgi:hypothetical protein